MAIEDYCNNQRAVWTPCSCNRCGICAGDFLFATQMLEFLRRFRVTEFLCVEIYKVHAHAVFHFAFTEIVQKQLPMPMLLQIFGDMFGKQNVPGIAAIHHPLRHM